MHRIGVDTGGTFTDCVLIDGKTQSVFVAKVPSQPRNPERAIAMGIARLLASAGLDPAAVDGVAHGTTIATNAVITGDFARAAMVTTQGCRDVVEIGSQQRPKLYDLHQAPRPALVPRQRRWEVGGRIAADGAEVAPLDDPEIRAAARRLATQEVESVAICGLFSFVNPTHEHAIARVLKEELPGLYVACSADISPEVREYPRFVTTAVNVALAPLLDPYIRRLEGLLREQGFDCRLFVMQSNGGVATSDRSVGPSAHNLVLSGPAAGVVAGVLMGARSGFSDLITLDVGGTSADIGIIASGQPRTRMEMVLPTGVPLHLRNLEIETIGAGGGSVAWVDPGGALHVGPASAGADPGPACYGAGGKEPTLTDAQVVLGRLNPVSILGGELKVDHAAARVAVGRIAERLGLSVEQAAVGIVAVTEANMAGAIRQSAAKHGDDLRGFALVAAGGAGPLNAASLAAALGMRTVLVPPRPGLFSATGLLAADLRQDLSLPLLMLGGEPDLAALAAAQALLEERADALLAEDQVPQAQRRCDHSLDLRYLGQEYSVTVAVERSEPLTAVIGRFHELHEAIYGHAAPGEPIEITAARAIAWGLSQPPKAEEILSAEPGRPEERRDVWFEEAAGFVATPVYDRAVLSAGQCLQGPAIIEQLDTTTVVPPGCDARTDAYGLLILSRE